MTPSEAGAAALFDNRRRGTTGAMLAASPLHSNTQNNQQPLKRNQGDENAFQLLHRLNRRRPYFLLQAAQASHLARGSSAAGQLYQRTFRGGGGPARAHSDRRRSTERRGGTGPDLGADGGAERDTS